RPWVSCGRRRPSSWTRPWSTPASFVRPPPISLPLLLHLSFTCSISVAHFYPIGSGKQVTDDSDFLRSYLTAGVDKVLIHVIPKMTASAPPGAQGEPAFDIEATRPSRLLASDGYFNRLF